MKLHFLGANRQVTGSRYLLEAGGLRIMVDCGMFQERCCRERNWAEFPIEPASVDHLLLTHAHLDHCGLLPRLVAAGYRNPIHATPPSIDLARLVMEDSARIQEEDAKYKKRRHKREGRTGPRPPAALYTVDDAKEVAKQFVIASFDKPIELNDRVSVRYLIAGHILGSAMIEVTVRENGNTRRIVFSGDIGMTDRPLLHDPQGVAQADYIIMESTYGNRNHGASSDIAKQLEDVINDTVDRGGNVLIPTFAIDRAQELLFHIGELVREKRIPRLPIFLDSPMAVRATTIYKRYRNLLDDGTQELFEKGHHPFQFAGLNFTRSSDESRAINSIRGSCIVLAGSGMCTGGRIKHHLRRNLDRPESTVLFVGYQSQDTLGRRILERDKSVRIHGRQYEVRAKIAKINGLSAHADQMGLLDWLGHLKSPPRGLFLTHGEEKPARALADKIRDRFGWDSEVPEYLQQVQLEA